MSKSKSDASLIPSTGTLWGPPWLFLMLMRISIREFLGSSLEKSDGFSSVSKTSKTRTRLTRGGAAGRRLIVSRSRWVIWHRSYTPNLSKSLLNSKRIFEFLMLLYATWTRIWPPPNDGILSSTFFSHEKHHNNSQKKSEHHPTARSLAFSIRALWFWALLVTSYSWHDQNQRRPVLWKPASAPP